MSARRYNSGKLEWSLIDFKSMEPMVEVLMYGKEKYTKKDEKGNVISTGANNWANGLSMREILESMARHMFALMSGEDKDPESGLPHIGHIMCNAMFYSWHEQNRRDKDDRYKNRGKEKAAPVSLAEVWNVMKGPHEGVIGQEKVQENYIVGGDPHDSGSSNS